MCAANSSQMFKKSNIVKLLNKSLISSPRQVSNYIIKKPMMVIPTQHFWTEYFKRRVLFTYPNVCNGRACSTTVEEQLIDSNTFEKVCEKTLDSLAEYFEELIASEPTLEKGDIIYGAGVLTVDLGKYGTYVINRQSPNRQIWLSSPISGPKRYDYSAKEVCWIYKHDGKPLHSLLENEISSILKKDIKISKCSSSSNL